MLKGAITHYRCAVYIYQLERSSLDIFYMLSKDFQDAIKRYFVDLRFMTVLMCVWLGVVVLVLIELGVFAKSKFIAFGPRPELSFMHVSIDTYYKYNILVSMIIIHTFVTDLIADSLVPHVLNFVQVPFCLSSLVHSLTH